MAEVLLVDNIKELRTLIDQQHLLYLELDESPRKIEQRNKLEGFIKKYLYIAPHDAKFTFHQTANVLHQSASTKNNFSAYKAAVAWKAIGKYADNLITHPWRKEYKDIKLYCGFYKHEVEENLVGAELMFEVMGYRHAGNSSMILPGILDPDRITNVSKDAITAFVECQIIKQIWESLSLYFNVTWLEILEFRENHTGTPEQVVRTLTYKFRQKLYHEQICHRPSGSNIDQNSLPPSDCHHGHHSIGYCNHSLYPGFSYSVPFQNRYGPPVNSQQMIPSVFSPPVPPIYASSHHAVKQSETYPVNGYHLHPAYSSAMNLQNVSPNGYSVVPMMYPVPSIVPTGQLIELDPFPPHNYGESYPHQLSGITKCNSTLENSFYNPDCLKHDAPFPSRKAADDGAGSWENWDYVYRNLESQGYKKKNESLGEISFNENPPSVSQTNSSHIDNVIQGEISERLKKVDLDINKKTSIEKNPCNNLENDNEVSKFKNKVEKTEFEKIKELKKSENKSVKGGFKQDYTRKTSDIISSSSSSVSKESTTGKNENEKPSTSRGSASEKRPGGELKALIVNLDEAEDKWQCVTCTYLNHVSNSVCEMCYKSRERGNELNPQPSGGAECPKCTLVNEPGLSNCAACNFSLKDSPTYI